jgi:hypothetical protein
MHPRDMAVLRNVNAKIENRDLRTPRGLVGAMSKHLY